VQILLELVLFGFVLLAQLTVGFGQRSDSLLKDIQLLFDVFGELIPLAFTLFQGYLLLIGLKTSLFQGITKLVFYFSCLTVLSKFRFQFSDVSSELEFQPVDLFDHLQLFLISILNLLEEFFFF